MAVDDLANRIASFVSADVKDDVLSELPVELYFGLIAGQTYWWWCELMGEYIDNVFRV